MNHRAINLPVHWQNWVAKHPDLSKGRLTPEFNNLVYIEFQDGSNLFFKHAFLVIDNKNGEVCVFTEHCGYHVFNIKCIDEYRSLKDSKTLKLKETD